MSGKKGQNVGPRVIRDAGYEPELGDPAKGAKVPRCAICGMPNREVSPLLPGLWRYASRQSIDLTLCEHCYVQRLPVLDPDPLTLDEVA